MGVGPDRIVDLLGLMGDSSDNVPGVRGVGPKTARNLLDQFDTLEDALEGASTLKAKKLGEKLTKAADDAILSKRLVTIDTDAPVKLDELLEQAADQDQERLKELFTELEFHVLLRSVAKSQAPPAEGSYRLVASAADRKKGIGKLAQAADWSFHVAGDKEAVGVAFSTGAGEAFYVSLDKKADREAVAAALGDPRAAKGTHDAKHAMKLLARRDISVGGLAFDTMIASYLTDPSQRQAGLEALALKHLGIKRRGSDVEPGGQRGLPLGDDDEGDPAPVACEDADLTLRLHRFFQPTVEAMQVAPLYRDLELPLIPILLGMESQGVKVDSTLLESISAEYAARLSTLEEEIHEIAGEEFNINSPRQLGPVLFEKLEIQKESGPSRVKRTKTGYSTDAEVLAQYGAHPIVARILEYRNLTKLRSTYLDALPGLVNPDTGRIHTTYNQAVAATGRLSSSDPNLQNIPIRTAEGRTIRKAFVAEEGHRLVSADYSQIELRILAHLTGDPGLVDVFRADRDVHRETAAKVFKIPADEVTPQLRSRSKAINFGIVYGMGPQRLARETDLSLTEAKAFIQTYFENFPKVKDYIDQTIASARETGASRRSWAAGASCRRSTRATACSASGPRTPPSTPRSRAARRT